MDIAMHINDHVLKELQSTPIHKLFPDITQTFRDNKHSVLYKSPNKNTTKTPQTNSKVKRNLNDSFNETSKSVNKNYSIIEDNDDSSLVLKLRLSNSQPYVHLQRSTEINRRLAEPRQHNRKTRRISFADESIKSIAFTRKSPRSVGRKSHTEFVSPQIISEEHENHSIKTRGKSIKSPEIYLRSKSVHSNQYESIKVNESSPNKRISRPRRSSVTQRSYKEILSDGSDNSCPSPPKRSKRITKRPVRYEELSDDIIDGIEELDISDIERNTSTPSPKKRAKNSHITQQHSPSIQTSISIPINNHTTSTVKRHSTITPPPTTTPQQSTRTQKTPSRVNKTCHINTTPKTTTDHLKSIRVGVLTPSVQSRTTAIKPSCTPLSNARRALHVAHVPLALPCREKEAQDIHSFVEGKLRDGCGGCMYISGVPGTGKTATVTFVVRQLQQLSNNGDLPRFDYVSVNGMRLTEPRQSYVEIFKQLTHRIVPWEQAHNQLNCIFTKKGQKGSNPIVLLIDELDILCTKRQDVVYNLLDWPSKSFRQLIVVTIANTMDLPERLLMGRVTSRLGLTRLIFQAYNHKQLQEIVTKRLHDAQTFNPDAIQLVARKVASVSGDARRALDICRRAAEMAEAEDTNNLISMAHVNAALDSMMTQPKIRAIKSSSRLQKLLLQSVVAEIERTGVEETTFSAVFNVFSSVAAIDGFAMVSMTQAMIAVAKLGACRLLLLDPKISGLYHRIMLNVSVDDVYYALKSD